MPEMTFTIRWPDGETVQCYSPSLVMHDHLQVGADYPVADFVGRAGRALDEASDRVRQRYGFACTSAVEQRERIEQAAAAFAADDLVHVLALEPPLPQAADAPRGDSPPADPVADAASAVAGR